MFNIDTNGDEKEEKKLRKQSEKCYKVKVREHSVSPGGVCGGESSTNRSDAYIAKKCLNCSHFC